jgi:hypothetical protein
LNPRTESNHVSLLIGSVRFWIQTIKIGFSSIWIGLDRQFNWISFDPLTLLNSNFHFFGVGVARLNHPGSATALKFFSVCLKCSWSFLIFFSLGLCSLLCIKKIKSRKLDYISTNKLKTQNHPRRPYINLKK